VKRSGYHEAEGDLDRCIRSPLIEPEPVSSGHGVHPRLRAATNSDGEAQVAPLMAADAV
jgi:hypothetical protein